MKKFFAALSLLVATAVSYADMAQLVVSNHTGQTLYDVVMYYWDPNSKQTSKHFEKIPEGESVLLGYQPNGTQFVSYCIQYRFSPNGPLKCTYDTGESAPLSCQTPLGTKRVTMNLNKSNVDFTVGKNIADCPIVSHMNCSDPDGEGGTDCLH